MNIPADIARDLPALLDFGKNAAISGLEGQVGAFMFRRIRQALSPFVPPLAEVDEKQLLMRIQRLESLAVGFSDAMHRLETDDASVMPDELLEPTAEDFTVAALDAAMESPSKAKQNVLGRLIAERLHCRTESERDLYLREALTMVRRCNPRHLHLLVTLFLVHDAPLPDSLTRAEMYDWLDENLLPVLNLVASEDPRVEDLDHLVTIGAAAFSEREWYESAGGMPSHAPGIEQRIIQTTKEHVLMAPGMQSPGAFYERASDLFRGRFSREEGTELVSLAPYTLTNPGYILANAVMDAAEAQQQLAL